MTDAVSTFELAAAELCALGIVLTRLPGEPRVNYRNGGEGTAGLADDLEQAVELGRALAADAPATSVRCGRRRRPLRMTPKAVRRRMIRQHNRRLRARMLRQQREES
jgi:hypothetical protein